LFQFLQSALEECYEVGDSNDAGRYATQIALEKKLLRDYIAKSNQIEQQKQNETKACEQILTTFNTVKVNKKQTKNESKTEDFESKYAIFFFSIYLFLFVFV
jgi:hypothetical protein